MNFIIRKIALLTVFTFIPVFSYADIVALKSDLTQFAQPLETQCKGLESYMPLNMLHKFLNRSNSEKIDVYSMDVIFVSDFLGYLEDKNCALAASDFTISGVKILNQYRDLWEKDLPKERKILRYETYLAAGDASLVKYKWTHKIQYLDDAHQFYTQYLVTNAISQQQKDQCGKKCAEYLADVSKMKYFDLYDYASISNEYRKLFGDIYEQYSQQDANFSDNLESLNLVFERTDQFEVSAIKTTGLSSVNKEVASLNNFDRIFSSGDKKLIELYIKRLDQYLQNRIQNTLLDAEMTDKIYQFLLKESNENNAMIVRTQQESALQPNQSFQIGKHHYIFKGTSHHVQLTFQPVD